MHDNRLYILVRKFYTVYGSRGSVCVCVRAGEGGAWYQWPSGRSLSTQRTRVQLQFRVLGTDYILKSADSRLNKRLSIHVEGHFQDRYIKCNHYYDWKLKMLEYGG